MTEGKGTESNQRIAWGRYLLVFFVAAWMFVLGLLVGRGTAPVQFDTHALQAELAAMRNAILKKEHQAMEKAMRGEIPKNTLDFHEALKKDEPDTTVDLSVKTAAVEETPAELPPTGEKPPPHKSRAVLMAKQRSAAVKPASVSPPPGTASLSPAAGPLTIQVASLKDGTAAERIVANLKKAGYPAYLSRIYIPDQGLWFRVRVGGYRNREQAAADIRRLVREQKRRAIIVNR